MDVKRVLVVLIFINALVLGTIGILKEPTFLKIVVLTQVSVLAALFPFERKKFLKAFDEFNLPFKVALIIAFLAFVTSSANLSFTEKNEESLAIGSQLLGSHRDLIGVSLIFIVLIAITSSIVFRGAKK